MNSFIAELIGYGIDAQHVAYLLLAPLIATVASLLRQLGGIRSLGVYHPLLLTFAFLALGIKQGLIAFAIIVIIANLATWLVKKFSFLYLPRMTIIVTVTTLSVIAMMALIQIAGYQLELRDYLPIIIIIALSDKLVSATIKRNIRPALVMVISTTAIAVIGFYLLQITWLQNQVLHYPFVSLGVIIILNIFLGRFKGLRMNEVWRFRQLLKIPPKK